MKNSHKVTFFVASLMSFARAQATSQPEMRPANDVQPNSGELLTNERMGELLARGILQYNPNTNAVSILREDAEQTTADKDAARTIKSIRQVFGSDVTIKVVPIKEMQLSTQDRKM